MKSFLKQTTPAVEMTEPRMRNGLVTGTYDESPCLASAAAVLFRRTPADVSIILCSTIDVVLVGEPVLLTYHMRLKCYHHARHVSVSTNDNCVRGLFYTNGEPA